MVLFFYYCNIYDEEIKMINIYFWWNNKMCYNVKVVLLIYLSDNYKVCVSGFWDKW